jgi:hypothetical protein
MFGNKEILFFSIILLQIIKANMIDKRRNEIWMIDEEDTAQPVVESYVLVSSSVQAVQTSLTHSKFAWHFV